MNPLRLSLLTASCAALLVLGPHALVQHQRRDEADRLRAENDRLRVVLLHRASPSASSTAAAAADHVVPPPAATEDKLPPNASSPSRMANGDTAPSDYRNEGQATPRAALQTLAWACDRGDAATVEKLLYFEPAARAKALQYLAALPAEVRTRWSTPEALAAQLKTSDAMNHPYPSAELLAVANEVQVSATRVHILMPNTNHERVQFEQTASGWKFVITESLVDETIAEMKAKH